MVWYFIGVYIIKEHYMAAWRYKISLLVLKKYFTRSLRLLVKCFSTLAEKFRISAWPCNILYIFLKKGNCSHLQCVPVQLFNVVIYAADINILEDSFDFLMMFFLKHWCSLLWMKSLHPVMFPLLLFLKLPTRYCEL